MGQYSGKWFNCERCRNLFVQTGVTLCGSVDSHDNLSKFWTRNFILGNEWLNISASFDCNQYPCARILDGELAEWSIAAVLKTVEPKGSGGSNPSLSAIIQLSYVLLLSIIFYIQNSSSPTAYRTFVQP